MSTGQSVLVETLEQMEDIVADNDHLEWDGWDVVSYSKRNTTFMNPKAKIWKGDWHHVQRYQVNGDGWLFPKGIE